MAVCIPIVRRLLGRSPGELRDEKGGQGVHSLGDSAWKWTLGGQCHAGCGTYRCWAAQRRRWWQGRAGQLPLLQPQRGLWAVHFRLAPYCDGTLRPVKNCWFVC